VPVYRRPLSLGLRHTGRLVGWLAREAFHPRVGDGDSRGIFGISLTMDTYSHCMPRRDGRRRRPKMDAGPESRTLDWLGTARGTQPRMWILRPHFASPTKAPSFLCFSGLGGRWTLGTQIALLGVWRPLLRATNGALTYPVRIIISRDSDPRKTMFRRRRNRPSCFC